MLFRSLVSVFRDSYLHISEKENDYDKINEAYFLGGHEQAVQALERNLNLHIDDYATFNWKAVVDAINVLGGVDIEISDEEFAYINSFITETVNSTGVGSYQLEHSGMNLSLIHILRAQKERLLPLQNMLWQMTMQRIWRKQLPGRKVWRIPRHPKARRKNLMPAPA